jgi:hypothetical protein
VDIRTTIGPTTFFPVVPNLFSDSPVLNGSWGVGILQPTVETGGVNFESLTHNTDWKCCSVLLDKRVLYRDSPAKYAALDSMNQCNTPRDYFFRSTVIQYSPRPTVQFSRNDIQFFLS